MDKENKNQVQAQPNSESISDANPTPNSSSSSGNRIIQPSDGFKQEIEAQKQQEEVPSPKPTPTNTSTAPESSGVFSYPGTIQSIDNNRLNPSQQSAIAYNELRSKENSKPVSLRVKSLLLVAIVTILAAIYSFTLTSSQNIVLTVLILIQLGMSIYLLVGKDHNVVALILKIYLVIQLLDLFLSLANPRAFMVNTVVTIFLFYVYSRVKSLSYY